jgi:hypothetical protein
VTITTSLNLAAIRAGIATILSGIPEIVKVNQYGFHREGVNNLPYAAIIRGEIQGQGITLQGEAADAQLGGYDHLIVWTIRVYAAMANEAAAQEFDDIIAGRLLDAFNGQRLIDPNGPGVVDSSRLTLIEPFMQDEEHTPLWVSTALLQTFVIATL